MAAYVPVVPIAMADWPLVTAREPSVMAKGASLRAAVPIVTVSRRIEVAPAPIEMALTVSAPVARAPDP